MFDIGSTEFILLAIVALFIFGPDRLPAMARQAARGVRQLRAMANNARRQFGQELGPEFENLDIADLNPRSFIRRAVFNGDEDDLDLSVDLDGHDARVDGDTALSATGASGEDSAERPPFDPDAT